jgi:hypothetical protein
VSPGDDGGPLTNGTLNVGTISVGDLDAWSFTANAGDSVVVRVGQLTAAGNFNPWLRIYGPDGSLVGSGTIAGDVAEEVVLTATNSGTFTVLVSDGNYGGYSGTGTYQLNYLKLPGGFVVSPGDDGGTLTNGTLNVGTISVGDLDAWSFSATNGDSVVVRIGQLSAAGNFNPWLRLYGPDGALVGSGAIAGGVDQEVELTATNSGTFTVLVSDGNYGGYEGTGSYALSLAHAPGAVFASPGDEGGVMTNGVTYTGTNSIGDLDVWSFYGTVGDSNLFRIATTNFTPFLRLYDPSGALVAEAFTANSGNRTNYLSYIVTNSGSYTLVSSAYYLGQSGTYALKQSRVPPDLILPDTQTITDEGVTLTVPVSAQDPDEPAKSLTFLLVSGPPGMTLTTLGPTNAFLSWTTTDADGPSTNVIVLTVTDVVLSKPFTRTNSFTVVVLEVNKPPVLPLIPVQTVNELTQLMVTNAASEPDLHSTTVGYGLMNTPPGVSIDPNGIIKWTPQQTQSPGTNTITTVVTNNNPYDLINPQLTATNSFTVIVKEVNQPPALPVISLQTVNELTPLAVTNTATEPNIHSVTVGYGLINPPLGLSISPNGVISWTPGQNQSPGTNTVTTVVTNSNPYDLVNPHLTATNSFTVIVKEVNQPPALPVIAPQNVNELSPLTVTNTASEPNIHSTTTGYGLINPPLGLSISPNGVISWIPGQNQSPGTNTVTIVVTNSNPYDLVNPQLTATNSFTVIVKEVNQPPILPAIPLQTINQLQPLTVTNTATEPNIHATTTGYGLINPPLGLTISPNGIISWTPTRLQSLSTNLIVTVVTNTDLFDTVNPHLTATNSFTIVVNETNSPPVLQPIADQSVRYGVLFSVQATASDPDIPTNTLTFSLDVAPTSMTINAASGLITWTPSLAQIGTNTVTVRVTDNGQPPLSDTTTFHVIVTGHQPVLGIQSVSGGFKQLSITGDVNVTYQLQISTNLVNWDVSGPITLTTSPLLYIDPGSLSAPLRFYRLKVN